MLPMIPVLTAPEPKPKIVRRNFFINVLDGTLWVFGITFVSSSTVLPVYLSHLTTSAVIIGIIPALELLGWMLPQIFTAPIFEGRARMKPYVLTIGFIQRLPYLMIAILIWWSGSLPPEANNLVLFLFLALYTLFAFCGGVAAIPWQEMVSRLFPMRQRGRFYAAQRFFGGILGLAGAFASGWLLFNVAYPYNFALSFLCAFVFMLISWIVLTQTVEAPQTHLTKPSQPARAYAGEYWALLKQDRAFVWYLIARGLGYLGWMATAFFAVYAVRAFDLQDAQAAVFSALLLVSSIASNAVWGWMGDKYSQKLVLILSSAAYLAALVLALFAATVYAYYAIFVLMGISSTGLMVSDLTLVVEFAPEAKRPTYMGLARGIWGPFIGLSPLLGGLLWAQLGYPVLIGVSLVLTFLGIVLVWQRVREPRHRQTVTTPAVVMATDEVGK
jgi:MFS family permease